MKTLLVDIESANNLQVFLKTVQNLDFVKPVKLVEVDGNEAELSSVKEPLLAYNWINPSRSASEDEIDELINAMENSAGEHSTEDVRQSLKKWATQKSK